MSPASGPLAPDEAGSVRPFSNGTEGYDWLAANCNRCQKEGQPDANGDGPCPMETAVTRGFIIGTVPADLAAEYGATIRGAFATMPRECTQFVPLLVCESIRTRNRRRCGKPATATVISDGRTHAVCERHERVFLAEANHV